MSSYRGSYIPWNSASNNTSKHNVKEKLSPSNSANRYSTARLSSNSSTNNNKNSLAPTPPATSYQYKKASSILKKYANFTVPSSRKCDNLNSTTKDSSKSSVPTCKTFSKFSFNKINENQQNSVPRYTNNSNKFSSQIAHDFGSTQPVFGSVTNHKETILDFVTFVSRATSPTPPHLLHSLAQPKRNGDDVLLFEAPRLTVQKPTQTNSTQTTDEEKPSSRVAALSSKFSSSGSCGISRYPATSRVSSYNYPRPTDLPIRSSSLTRSYPSSERLEVESRLSPNVQHYVSSPSAEQRLQATSPLSTLNKSLTNLTIGDPADSETEDESSYNEDYPMRIGKESCSLMVENPSLELSDKPPKYPLSPNLSHRKIPALNERFRTSTSSSCSSTRHDSSSEDFCDKVGSADRNIPLVPPPSPFDHEPYETPSQTRYEESTASCQPKLYPLRKMDSADQPWWLNSGSESQPSSDHTKTGRVIRKMDSTEFLWTKESSDPNNSIKSVLPNSDTSRSESEGIAWWFNTNTGNNSNEERRESSSSQQNGVGYVIRKMDSFDVPWWCKSSDDTNKSSKCVDERDHSSSCAPTDEECRVGFAIRKMDSNEILWGRNPEESVALSHPKPENASHLSQHSDDFSVYKIRKFDSSDRECWAEDERSKTGTPDWWNSKGDDSESVESYKRSQSFRIKKIEPVELDKAKEPNQQNGFKIQKIDSGERPWWMAGEATERPSGKSDETPSSDGVAMKENEFFENTNYKMRYIDELENLLLYIGKYTNIDDLLGTEVPPPAAPRTPTDSSSEEDADIGFQKIAPCQVKIHDGSAYTSTIQRRNYQVYQRIAQNSNEWERLREAFAQQRAT